MLPAEYAFDFVYALGEVGLLQFKDLNADKTAFQRTYANQVCGGKQHSNCPSSTRMCAGQAV